ncbi:hypothetical protein J4437_03245 [Candidatus Woesearchaeota archaeon]|nr:hypothetical protein [Candidatus Woesearchaeota archaeon]
MVLMLDGKRGQVTIFIIVGIILLFTFAGIFYATKVVKQEALIGEEVPVIAAVPLEFQPVQSFTEDCLAETAKSGLVILGQQGGYIYPELIGEFSKVDPAESDGLDLESAKVPFWYYNNENNAANKVSFTSLKPKLYAREDATMSVEAQLGRFVKEKVNDCLGQYETFSGQGFSVTAGEVQDVTVGIGEQKVSFLLEKKIEAQKGEARTTMEKFFVRINLPLKQYYDAASIITNAERNFTFLENQALELLQIYSDVNVEKLAPTSAVTFELVPTASWNAVTLARQMKSLLTSYVPMLRSASNSNLYRYQYPVSELSALYQKNYDNSVLSFENLGISVDTGSETGGRTTNVNNPANSPLKNLDVNFDYFGWEPYFKANGNTGVIKPDHLAVNYFLLHFGMQNYRTVYDLSYPVLVTLRDREAFNGEGYTFNFALESNIRNNNAAVSGSFEEPKVNRLQNLACAQTQRNTDVLKTVVIDSYTKEPLEAVQVLFSIPEQDNCPMGLTDKKGVLAENYPAIYGGSMSVIKQDYLTNFYPIDTYKYKQKYGSGDSARSAELIGYAAETGAGVVDVLAAEFELEMHKYHPVNISVMKKRVGKCIGQRCFGGGSLGLVSGSAKEVYSYIPEMLDGDHKHIWRFFGTTQSLGDKEQVTLSFKRISDINPNAYGETFSTAVVLKGGENEGKSQVSLVPGVYEVSGIVMDQSGLVIPSEERCTGGIADTCYTFDEVNMDVLVGGQLNWNTPATYLKITSERLYPSDEIVFYIPTMDINSVPAQPHIRIIEDLNLMGQMENISKMPELRSALMPIYR